MAAAPNPGQAQTSEDPALKAAKAAKDLADAQKAQRDSELALFKATVGDVPGSGLSGAVKLGSGAGVMETALLSAVAANEAAGKIAEAVGKALDGVLSARVLVYPAGQEPNYAQPMGLYAQRTLLLRAFQDVLSARDEPSAPLPAARQPTAALTTAPAAAPSSAPRTESITAGAAGIALDVASKLLSYFKADYEISGTELNPDDALLATAVCGALIGARCKEHPLTVFLKSGFNPAPLDAIPGVLTRLLAALPELRAAASTKQASVQAEVDGLQSELAAATDDSKKKQLTDAIARAKARATRIATVIAAYDAFVDKLGAPDEKMATAIKDLATWDSMRDDGMKTYVLTVKVHKAGGSQYVEKSLWTLMGFMSYYIAGGVTTSFALYHGDTGQLCTSAMYPVHGGFVKASSVANRVR